MLFFELLKGSNLAVSYARVILYVYKFDLEGSFDLKM